MHEPLDGTHPALCTVCHNYCGILVTIEDGRPVKVKGDRRNAVSGGYTCVKGRNLPAYMNRPDRLLHSVKRVDDEFVPIESGRAVEEIAEQIRAIVDEHGPRSVAMYTGSWGLWGSPFTWPMVAALGDALGTPMVCDSDSIDMPGKHDALAMHGSWMAPLRTILESEVALVVGSNPLISHVWASPGQTTKRALARGTKLIVIDPRRTEFAQRAFLHIQPRPGEDIAILAAICKVVLDEGLQDADFLADNAQGVEALHEVLGVYDVDEVARRAGITRDEIVLAARTIGGTRRFWGLAGTGPNMAQSGTVLEYLLLVLETLTGSWPRAGELIENAGTLVPEYPAIAQAESPVQAAGMGVPLRARDFVCSSSGLQTAAMPDEILFEGEGRVRALISCGGNPALAWPDQEKTLQALDKLDLLVQIDPVMSPTAQMADYVIAPKIAIESHQASILHDTLVQFGPAFLRPENWGQYVPPRAAPPAGSDLIEDWEFYFSLGQHLGLQLALPNMIPWADTAPYELDMSRKPTNDELLEIIVRGSRVPLTEIKKHPYGLSDDHQLRVAPKSDGWTGRLDVGNREIMRDLQLNSVVDTSFDEWPYRFISRRRMHHYGSTHIPTLAQSNPAFMNPSDLDALHLEAGDRVKITSRRASIVAIVEPDPTVRVGCVSMSHGHGASDPLEALDVEQLGSPASRLSSMDEFPFDRYQGQPLMSGIPITVERARQPSA